LHAEVFGTKDFQDWAKKNVVLLTVDFPQKTELPKELKKQNDELKNKNKVDGFPTILFFDAKGEVVGKMGYQEGGPSKWTKDADKIVAKAKR
jgi:thioredoxin-related protein